MKYPLQRVKRAARSKTRTETEYRAALHAARVAGITYTEIAEAAGTTRQAVRQLLERNTK
jgi:predicted transcriptional regulator